MYPLVWISTLITHSFSKSSSNEISRDEIIALASIGHKEGAIGHHENDYLTNALRLSETRTEQILTPRTVMHSLSDDLTVSQALDDKNSKQFTRVPVFKKDNDDIVGVVISRDLYRAERDGMGDAQLQKYVKPINRVSESLPVQQLLDLFINRHEHVFLVEDKFGQTVGIVTLEDAIETLLGRENVDENDTVEDLQALAKGKYHDRIRKDKS